VVSSTYFNRYKQHKVDILRNIFVIYITMRMRQFLYMNNKESKNKKINPKQTIKISVENVNKILI